VAKKNHRRRKNNSNTGLTFIMGVGLILIGLAAFLMLQGTKNIESSQPVSMSVIPMEVNYSAPELSLQNVNGKTESLISYREKVVLVNNWATWCPPCKAEMPTLEKYYETHAAEGFAIVAIEAGDGKDQVVQFVNSHSLKFYVWLDPNGASLNAFGNGNLPNSYVIDRNGAVRYAWTGEINLVMLEKYVTPLIAGSN
jgi:peroxiredoxin